MREDDHDGPVTLWQLLMIAAIGIVITAGVLLSEGCKSNYRVVSDAEIRAARLEERISEIDARIGGHVERLESVQDKARGIEDTVDRVIWLFDEYDREVRGIIADYYELKRKAETMEESSSD